MAYNIKWQVQFMSLRTSNVYTVNVYKDGYTGNPIMLKGGDKPFETQEDNNEDMFTFIRKQSGYLRIVDDGYAADGVTPFSWKDMIPAIAISHPVTLTNAGGTVLWQGFMQAQVLDGDLYETPQEREFPLQCVLSVLSGSDFDGSFKNFRNFARLLTNTMNGLIPNVVYPTGFMIGGGNDVIEWLQKKVDGQNFIDTDNEGNLINKYNREEVLEEICKFWGWSVRMQGPRLYLTCADDADEQTWLYLTLNQLEDLSIGTSVTGSEENFLATTIGSDAFASDKQNEYVQRGYSKVVLSANSNNMDAVIFDVNSPEMDKATMDGTVESVSTSFGNIIFFSNKDHVNLPFLTGYSDENSAVFSYVYYNYGNTKINNNALRFKKSYTGASLMEIYTDYFHNYYITEEHGRIVTSPLLPYLYLSAKCYQRNTKITEDPYSPSGNHTMKMMIGIGKTFDSAKWLTFEQNHYWSTTRDYVNVVLGIDDHFRYMKHNGVVTIDFIPLYDVDLNGRLFLLFLGSDTMPEIDGEREFYLTDFKVELKSSYSWEGYRNTPRIRPEDKEYKIEIRDNIKNEWSEDCEFASNNGMAFGSGIVMNSDCTYMTGYDYQGNGTEEHPEQHLVNRVGTYGATSKRRLELELRSDKTAYITPQHKVSVDGSLFYPISISHEWREDVLKVTMLEINQ